MNSNPVKYLVIGVNCRFTHSCLALFYVRNELERHVPGCQVDLVEFTINDTYYDTLLRVSQSGADGLFFSVYIWNSDFIDRLVRDLIRILPGTPIILGGPQASSLEGLPDDCTVVDGEIEGVNKSFYQDLVNRSLSPVYRSAPGALFHSPYRQTDFSKHLKNKHIYYESSRGCPFFCAYCLSSIKRGVFHKNIKEVKEELGKILETKPKLIKFVDRTFNDNPERALQIWQFLVENGGETRFHFEIAPDRFTEKMFQFLETVPADLFQFEIGIQSTHPETLIAVNRHMDVQAAARNVERLVRLDTIHIHADLILGLPFENRDSFEASFNSVYYMRPHYIQMGLLKVLPGTEIRRKAGEYGLVYCEQPTYNILGNNWMDHQALAGLHDFGECVEAFYNNRYFRTLWDYLFRRNEDPFAFFSRLLEICRKYNFFVYSPTQKLLTAMLVELAKTRSDRDILLELLRYDWLRCGHRFLPESLGKDTLSEVRLMLASKLPQNMKGFYSHRNRNDFFKSSVFLNMSAPALKSAGLESELDEAYVCFLSEQTSGVHKHCKVLLLQGPST